MVTIALENTVTISLSEYESLKEKAKQKIRFFDQEIICPYCKFKNKLAIMGVSIGLNHEFISCDSESGGCDRKILIRTEVYSQILVTAHKLPGEK